MTIPIHDQWTPVLLSLPETGMGYQIVEVREPGRPPLPALVLNGDRLAERLGRPMVVRERPSLGEADRLSRIFKSAPIEAELRVLRAGEPRREGWHSGGAEGATPEISEAEARFLRYSAFLNDRRILPDGALLPGTFATTWEDGKTHVFTGSQAVRRYAIPNPDPAIHEFALKPPVPVIIRQGVVQPAHGQPGGGVEVIFDNGSPPKTLIAHRELPP